jgi:23S rRNA pseudouridine1911/1915/1917 synthase
MADAFTATPGRLDSVLARLAALPRADVQRAIAAGGVTVDGQVRPKSYRLGGGEEILATIDPDPPLTPEGPPVEVRHDDEHLMIIAKPAGLVTHPTATRRTGTLVNRLLGMQVELSSVGGPLRPGIVHRLDAGTSGLMVVAHTDLAHEALAAMFKAHAVERRYLAMVRGDLEHESFGIDAPLGRRQDKVVVDRTGGRAARTEFRVLERFGFATLVEAAPATGRTHQIRVHLTEIGHPILGDRAYRGGGEDATSLELTRPFLHSRRIAFVHPVATGRIEIDEPAPADLERAIGLARDRRDLRP